MQHLLDMLRIKAFPRIHISLIGMNRDGYRLNGGIGFSISSPALELSFEPSNSICIDDYREHGFTKEELSRLKSHLEQVIQKEHFDSGFRCVIHESIIQSHVGFGSNSIVYLSCIEALLIFNKKKYNEDYVINLSGRGGTSGIGINTYFKGGYVFDAGILNCCDRQFAPSSTFVSKNNHKPLLLNYIKLPKWDLGIFIPKFIPKTEEEEKAFFNEKCPIGKEAVEEIMYEAVYGITTSLMECEFMTFCKSIDSLQLTKWKKLERELYGKELLAIESIIRNAGAICVGMSSLGPLLYFFGDDVDSIVEKVKVAMPDCICFKTLFNNIGRILEYD